MGLCLLSFFQKSFGEVSSFSYTPMSLSLLGWRPWLLGGPSVETLLEPNTETGEASTGERFVPPQPSKLGPLGWGRSCCICWSLVDHVFHVTSGAFSLLPAVWSFVW